MISFLTIALYILLGIYTAQQIVRPFKTVYMMLKEQSKLYDFGIV